MINERQITAYVTDDTAANVRMVFIRLVPRGTVRPSNTWRCDCHVDLDNDDNVLGVTFFLHPNWQTTENPQDLRIRYLTKCLDEAFARIAELEANQ